MWNFVFFLCFVWCIGYNLNDYNYCVSTFSSPSSRISSYLYLLFFSLLLWIILIIIIIIINWNRSGVVNRVNWSKGSGKVVIYNIYLYIFFQKKCNCKRYNEIHNACIYWIDRFDYLTYKNLRILANRKKESKSKPKKIPKATSCSMQIVCMQMHCLHFIRCYYIIVFTLLN